MADERKRLIALIKLLVEHNRNMPILKVTMDVYKSIIDFKFIKDLIPDPEFDPTIGMMNYINEFTSKIDSIGIHKTTDDHAKYRKIYRLMAIKSTAIRCIKNDNVDIQSPGIIAVFYEKMPNREHYRLLHMSAGGIIIYCYKPWIPV